MTDDTGARDKKIQATISSEVKEQVRALVKQKGFESESEFLRTAVTEYIAQQTTAPKASLASEVPPLLPTIPSAQTDLLHRDLKERVDLIAWMMTVGLVLISGIGARLLRAMGEHEAGVGLRRLRQQRRYCARASGLDLQRLCVVHRATICWRGRSRLS